MTQTTIYAYELEQGDTILLPMGRTATVQSVKVGHTYANIVTEYGKSRYLWHDEVTIEKKAKR